MDIADWREKIDELDRELVRLLNERARCSVEIGRLKRQNGWPVHEPNREREVLSRAIAGSQGPLDSEAIERLVRHIVEEGKALQQRLFDQQTATPDQK